MDVIYRAQIPSKNSTFDIRWQQGHGYLAPSGRRVVTKLKEPIEVRQARMVTSQLG
ncbi:hypothetical protein PM082_004718 [Marasmius tenuissimus]|nr:hypothetical protein PM082_004718 [Marasmius tenuissimus]